MRARALIAGLCALGLTACSKQPATPASNDAASGPRPEPIVVYAAHDEPSYWPAVFEEFTGQTGIRVTVRQRDAATLVDEVISNIGSPPADVLLTPSVYGALKAADDGALQPLGSNVVGDHVPQHLRDADDYWVAVKVRHAVIAYSPETLDVTGLTDYASLGDERFRQQLCLTSSGLPLNRALIAQLIDAEGARPAELAVRQWVFNLARPPFADDQSLLAAIAAGACKLGIVSSESLPVPDGMAIVVPASVFGDLDGVGVARHARQPDSARQLIQWLAESRAGSFDDPGGPRNIGRAAWRIDDAIKLALRASYR